MTVNHGKNAAVYRLLLEGYKPATYGSGLNDLTWGPSDTETDSSYFEVVIDSELGGTAGVDTFKWRENGGGFTSGVDITGASQALAGANMNANITFAATTGHALNDQWSQGNFKDEPTTVSTNDAQITDATNRLINPNATLVVTPSNAVSLKSIDFATGTFHFDGAPGVTTITGDDGFVLQSGLTQIGFMTDWSMDLSLDSHDLTAFQDDWAVMSGGIARGTGKGWPSLPPWAKENRAGSVNR